jgi:hypothetical protein
MNRKTNAAAAALFLLACACAWGQAARTGVPVSLRGSVRAGEVLHYELEVGSSFLPRLTTGYTTSPPMGPCQFAISSNLTLRVGSRDRNGNTPVEAEYTGTRLTNWQCGPVKKPDVESALGEVEASPALYQVGAQGEVGFKHPDEDHFSYLSAIDLLRKVTLDLLETRLADAPVVPDATWKPRGQFTYWKDYLLSGLEPTHASMKFKEIESIAGRSCGLVTTKYVFAPTEVREQNGTIFETRSDFVSSTLDVSLLLDMDSQHIGWLRRQQQIDNRISVGEPVAGDPERPPALAVHVEETATARLLPAESSLQWLAALERFEASPQPVAPPADQNPANRTSLGDVARAMKPKVRHRELESLDFTPGGFSRWEKALCMDRWFCADLSLALPGEVELAEETPERAVFLARTDGMLLTITVGPTISRAYWGLRPGEELRKNSQSYLANQLWMATSPGVATTSEDGSVDGYSALFTEFSAERRDLGKMSGMLALLLTPWAQSLPVACTSDHASYGKVRSVCTQVISSVRVRRSSAEAGDEP